MPRVALLVVLLAGCSPAPEGAQPAPAGAGKAAGPSPVAAAAQVHTWTLPAPSGAAQPDLVVTPRGRLLLSWIEPLQAGGHRLRLAHATPGQGWDEPLTVAEGGDWFVNWADTPHVYALADGSLWAHWLRSTGPSRMDYGVALSRSADGGRSWSPPRLLHPPTRGDHGFVSFWSHAADGLGVAWLDSRQKASAGAGAPAGDGHHPAGGAAMMLRGAVLDAQAATTAEWPLDTSTCDCCTTSAAMTARGPVVVYRGRSAAEVRDTRIVRLEHGQWSAPRDVHADGWTFPGCPVNGPVVLAEGSDVWVAWYTEAAGRPELRAARSLDAGDSFGAPVTLAAGPQVLGRVALALADTQLLAAWLEEDGQAGQRLLLGRYDRQWQEQGRVTVARLRARGRASGLPRLRWADGSAWVLWTGLETGPDPAATVLQGARVSWAAPVPPRP